MKKLYSNKLGNMELTQSQGFGFTKITGGSKNNKRGVMLFNENDEKGDDCGLKLHITNSGAIEIIYEGAEFKNCSLMDIVFNKKFNGFGKAGFTNLILIKN